ncbi:hypothetical protein [Roseimaritima sediminicola]|uniref:hypothetical protein n=1 Tax=Roseimaritima sediminicola TaxID=2662066 RepID=UPI001298487A|nr:hypothetical protein [Roseimaritima sediminicola]
MRISPIGALTGAGVSAVSRVGVVLFFFPELIVNPIVLLPSAGLGVLVGMIAGALRPPLIAAGTGALLSAIVLELFILPCASLLGAFGSLLGDDRAGHDFLIQTSIYLVGMGIAGAVGGGVGSLIGQLAEAEPLEPQLLEPQLLEPQPVQACADEAPVYEARVIEPPVGLPLDPPLDPPRVG